WNEATGQYDKKNSCCTCEAAAEGVTPAAMSRILRKEQKGGRNARGLQRCSEYAAGCVDFTTQWEALLLSGLQDDDIARATGELGPVRGVLPSLMDYAMPDLTGIHGKNRRSMKKAHKRRQEALNTPYSQMSKAGRREFRRAFVTIQIDALKRACSPIMYLLGQKKHDLNDSLSAATDLLNWMNSNPVAREAGFTIAAEQEDMAIGAVLHDEVDARAGRMQAFREVGGKPVSQKEQLALVAMSDYTDNWFVQGNYALNVYYVC
ncbi:unnamed protein product, partial [Prorocentrum cordatum]